MRDLNDLIDPSAGWLLASATGIKAAGQITGTGDHGGQTRAFLLTPVVEAGDIGSSLRIARSTEDGFLLEFSWADGCGPIAPNYSVYEGSLGDFQSHAPIECSTGSLPGITLVTNSGNRYYLVVPHDTASEGSYGRDSIGGERARAANACSPEWNPAVCQ